MRYKTYFMLLILAILTVGCGTTKEAIEVNYYVQKVPGGNFQVTVNEYFRNFDDIRKWEDYSTDAFVKRAYSWCIGDNSEEKTIDEMVEIYYELNKYSLKLKSVVINQLEVSENEEVILSVTRTWENEEQDETNYVMVIDNGDWKVDDQF